MEEDLFHELVHQLHSLPAVRGIYAYPHPLTAGGVVVVADSAATNWEAIVATAYRCQPQGRSLFCIRADEFALLSRPGIFAPPLQINELPHLRPWLQQRGRVLWGLDERNSIPPPAYQPQLLLFGHLEGCRDTLRRYGILPLLLQEEFSALLAMLRAEMRRLMSTALLLDGIWEIDLQDVPAQFWERHPAETTARDAWERMPATPLPGDAKEAALDAVWHFERFILALQRMVPCR